MDGGGSLLAGDDVVEGGAEVEGGFEVVALDVDEAFELEEEPDDVELEDP